MAYYAFLDNENIVTEVIKGCDEGNYTIAGDWIPAEIDYEIFYGNIRNQVCKRTSFNTRGGVYYDPNTGEPSPDQSKAFRKNYAGIGYKYDAVLDGFIPKQPFPSWTLNQQTGLWDCPKPYPNDGKFYWWDEQSQSWVEAPSAL